MCWAEKCCYIVPLNLACVVLGIANFVISLALTTVSMVYYFSEKSAAELAGMSVQPHLIAPFLGLDLKMATVNIILSVVVIVCLFWMVFSVLLIAGIVKNEPSLILCYFSFGIILTILCMLGGLLMLINTSWWPAIVLMIASMINIHFLVVVHTVYELMQKGKDFRISRQEDDEDPLADCFDENDDDV